MNDVGADIARSDGDKVIEAIRLSPHLAETDAFMLIAGAAGRHGFRFHLGAHPHDQGALPGQPVYNMIVLPFRYEEATEERSIYNVGTCLKSSYLAAGRRLLVDNQRYLKKNAPIRNNLAKINRMVVKPFYNLLCAGEKPMPSSSAPRSWTPETSSRRFPAGPSSVTARPRRPLRSQQDRGFPREKFRNGARRAGYGRSLGDLSVKCNPTEAKRLCI